jgi:hypothetical protein
MTALLDAVTAASKAKIVSVVSLSPVSPPSGSATDGPFSAYDKLVVTFETSDSTVTRLVVPSPDERLLLRDETLDPSSSTVISGLAAVSAVIRSPGGSAVTRYVSGRRSRHVPRSSQ